MDYYIFYIKFDDKIMAIYCSEMMDDPKVEGHTLFKGVKYLNDDAFPRLKVSEISLPKIDIKYYLKGTEVEEEEEIPAAPKESPRLVKQKDVEKQSESIENTKVFERRKRLRRKVIKH